VKKFFQVFKSTALIDELSEKVVSLTTTVDTLETDRSAMVNSVKEHKKQLEELTRQNAEMLASINALEEKLRKVDTETKHNLRRIKDARTVAAQRDLLYHDIIVSEIKNNKNKGACQ